MTVTLHDRFVEDDRPDDARPTWWEPGGPAARTLFTGHEDPDGADLGHGQDVAPGRATDLATSAATRVFDHPVTDLRRDGRVGEYPRVGGRRPRPAGKRSSWSAGAHPPRPRVVRPDDARRRPRLRSGAPTAVACEAPDAPSIHGARLTARGRVLVAVAWAVLALVAAVPVVGAVSADAEPAPATVTTTVTSGDSLWDLARSVDPSGDPRELVGTIVELNGLDSSSDIHAGDRLVVPAAP